MSCPCIVGVSSVPALVLLSVTIPRVCELQKNRDRDRDQDC